MLAVVLWQRPVQPTPPTTPTQITIQFSNFPANALGMNSTPNIVSNSVSNQLPLTQSQATNSRPERFKQMLEQKNVPITFYGRVLDQDGNKIAGVQIVLHVRPWHLDATADPWGNKFPKFERVTDAN